MDVALALVALAAGVIAVTAVCRMVDLPSPLVLIVVGIVVSFLPFVPDVELRSEVVLLGLLPPLLYSTAIQTSLVDFNANRRVILLLSVGLVVFTTLGVGLLVHALVPQIAWSSSFAIGAVVAPPDAVAATSIGRRIGLPRRIVTILEGESLVNDATALTALRTALLAVVSWRQLVSDFLVAAVGGVLVGLAFYYAVAYVRRHLHDPVIDSGLSLVVPFAAYLAAEEIHVGGATPSGVLAVVVAGLLLGHKSPVLQNAQTRIAERLNWRSISYLLESAVFLLIGLQAQRIIRDATGGALGLGRLALVCAGTLAGVVALRMGWVYASRAILMRPRRSDDGNRRLPPWSYTTILGWAGMRGVVTLAAAFVIPQDTPYRAVLLLIAFTVTAGTLFLQGLTLPWLARRLQVPSPDPMADALARANLMHQSSQAGLARLDELESEEEDPHDVSTQLRDRMARRDFSAWERVGASESETPSEIYNRRRRAMIAAERDRVLEVRSSGKVAAEVVSEVLAMLDVEESMLDYSEGERTRMRTSAEGLMLEGDCEHLQKARPPVEPHTPGECEECVEEGLTWVHLRMCVSCGHVGCCDSSPQRHASVHFEKCHHPVMRSAEPGEDWRWCFVDEITG